jgi:hypothetical protein
MNKLLYDELIVAKPITRLNVLHTKSRYRNRTKIKLVQQLPEYIYE